MINNALLNNVGLRIERFFIPIGGWFVRRFRAAETAFKAAGLFGGILTLVGYLIAYTGFNLYGGPYHFVLDCGIGVMALAGIVSALFCMIVLAELGAAGIAAAGLLGVAEQVSRPIPGSELNFSEVWDTDRTDKFLRQVAAVFAGLMFINVYSVLVPVYASLSRFLLVCSLTLFVMFVAFSFNATMVWWPRIQRLAMFVAAGMIVIFTAQLFALSAGTTLSSMLNPFGMKYDSTTTDATNNLAPEVASWASALSKQTGMSETAAYALFTLGWVVVILLFIGIVIPWLLRATGIIEKPLRAESAAPTASKSTGGWSASTIVKVVVGLVLVFIAGSWVIAGMAWMIENARPENNQDTRGSVVQPAKAGVPQSVSAGELPTRWDTVGAFSLKAENDWQSTAIQLSPNECVSFELAGWTGSVLVEVGEGHGQLVVKNGGMITSIHKGELKIKVFSVTSDKDSACSVIVRKRVG